MSQYLTIKKDGVIIGQWSRSSEVYDAFENAPYGKEAQFDPKSEFTDAKAYLRNEVKNLESLKSTYKDMLDGNLTYDERFETLSEIKHLEEEIENLNISITYVDFMEFCWDCDSYFSNPPKWTWVID